MPYLSYRFGTPNPPGSRTSKLSPLSSVAIGSCGASSYGTKKVVLIKDGNGKELRRLHDTVNQHLRTLKAMDHDPPGSFVTSMLELKLDATTTFEWQRYSKGTLEVPMFTRLLDFLNLRAQASESSAPEFAKKRQVENATPKRNPTSRLITAYVAAVDDACRVQG